MTLVHLDGHNNAAHRGGRWVIYHQRKHINFTFHLLGERVYLEQRSENTIDGLTIQPMMSFCCAAAWVLEGMHNESWAGKHVHDGCDESLHLHIPASLIRAIRKSDLWLVHCDKLPQVSSLLTFYNC